MFVTLEEDECRRRRDQRTDYDPADLPGYFDQIVWPAYLSHLKGVRSRTDDPRFTFIDGAEQVDTAFLKQVLERDFEKDLVRIQTEQIATDELIKYVSAPGNGAISFFIGS